jgi:hypothetical protein
VKECGEQRPVSRSEPQPRATELPLQYSDLVPQRQDLDVLVSVAHREQAEQGEGVRQAEVSQSQQHADHPAVMIGRPEWTGPMATERGLTSTDEVFGKHKVKPGDASRTPHRHTLDAVAHSQLTVSGCAEKSFAFSARTDERNPVRRARVSALSHA